MQRRGGRARLAAATAARRVLVRIACRSPSPWTSAHPAPRHPRPRFRPSPRSPSPPPFTQALTKFIKQHAKVAYELPKKGEDEEGDAKDEAKEPGSGAHDEL